MRVVIAGAGLAGSAAALVLARDGHEVVLLEPDPPPGDLPADALADRVRPGAPQAPHPHNFMPLARRWLAERLPDVHAACLARGGVEVDMRPHLPEGRADAAREHDLVALALRRPLLEDVLRRTAEREPGVEVRTGCAVDVTPHGLRTTDGVVEGDLLVDAAGRRSPLPAALAAQGQPVSVRSEPCGITYVTRQYRLRSATHPAPLMFGLASRVELPWVMAALFLGDDRTFSVIVGTPPADRELRRVLADPQRYDAALLRLPTHAPWVAAADGISGVRVMGGLHNVLVETGPLTVPYVGIGDAVLTTNPRLGWGASLAFAHVELLRAAVREDDPAAAARAAVQQDAGARWTASAEEDRMRSRWWAGGPWEPSPAARLAFGATGDRGLAVAAVRRLGLLDAPDDHLALPRMRESLETADIALRARGPITEPAREDVLAGLTPPAA